MTFEITNTVIYCQRTHSIINFITDGATVVPADYASQYGGDLVIISFEEAARRREEAFRQPVSETTRGHFWYSLECLPPVGWHTASGVESFKISERYSGNLTAIFARLGNRYFTLRDDIRLPAEEIAARVAAFAAENPASPKAQERSRYCGNCSHEWVTPVFVDDEGEHLDRVDGVRCPKCRSDRTHGSFARFATIKTEG